MARKADVGRLDMILETIDQYPNSRPGAIARRLKLPNKTVMRALPLLEARGDLLAEDERGGLSVVARDGIPRSGRLKTREIIPRYRGG